MDVEKVEKMFLIRGNVTYLMIMKRMLKKSMVI